MRTQKERMLAGELYKGDNELRKMNRRNRRIINIYNSTTVDESDKRKELIRELVAMTGKRFHIEPPFYCDYGDNIYLGENFYANFDCIMLDVAKITIGDNVMFGPRVSIYTAGHPIDAVVRNSGLEYGKSVRIGNNVWIGGNTVVNPNVVIRDNVVIGSGSVVTKDIPSNVIAAGNPCRIIREINDKDFEYWNELKKQYDKEMED